MPVAGMIRLDTETAYRGCPPRTPWKLVRQTCGVSSWILIRIHRSTCRRLLPLQVPRPPAAGRGDGSITHERCSGTPDGVVQVGEVRLHAQASPVLRCLLVFTMGERHFSTRNVELVATAVARLEDEDDPPAPTALGGRPASCKQLPHP